MKTKKIIFVVLVSVMVSLLNTAYAQLEKGGLLIGGEAGFRSFSPEGGGESVSYINITPGVGYFVIDNLALGARISYQSISSDGETVSIFTVGPFARYYIGDTKVFGEVSYDFGSVSGSGDSESLSNLMIEAGYSAFLNDHVAIEPAFYWSTQSSAGESVGSSFGINIGLQIYLGK